MAKEIAWHLTNKDPSNKKLYAHNLAHFLAQLTELDADLTKSLASIASAPYIVFHDAYQYLEEKYKLNGLGAISINFSHTPGIHTMAKIKQIVAENKVKCIFKEPNLSNNVVEKIAANTNVKIASLDAEWVDASKDAYLVLMRNLATSMVNCLK
jgi:zinc transport system substrate-binding protein